MGIGTTIGSRVKTLRESRGMSQKELGDIIGLNPDDVSRLEAGVDQDISAETIKRVCEAFREYPSFLIFEEDDEYWDRMLDKKPSPNSSDKGTVPTKTTEMMTTIGTAIESTLGRKGLSIIHSMTALNETGLARASMLVSDLLKIRDYRSGK